VPPHALPAHQPHCPAALPRSPRCTQAFHQRIAFCLDLHNEATRAMRFDHSDGAKRKLEDADAAKERAAAEAELAEAMDEEDD
jgi:26S proteasome regulatory subunit N3